MVLKFYTALGKGLKLKVRKFWELIRTFVELAGEKLVEGDFFDPPPHLEVTIMLISFES